MSVDLKIEHLPNDADILEIFSSWAALYHVNILLITLKEFLGISVLTLYFYFHR